MNVHICGQYMNGMAPSRNFWSWCFSVQYMVNLGTCSLPMLYKNLFFPFYSREKSL